MQKYESLHQRVSELALEPAWWSDVVKLPAGFTIILRGASREVPGESVRVRRADDGSVEVTTLEPCLQQEGDTAVFYASLEHALRDREAYVLVESPDYDCYLGGLLVRT